MKKKTKVIVYIYRLKNNSKELLIFSHRDFPEAGLQVVGGTVEPEEDLKLALKREILEESGLTLDTSLMNPIGETIYHRKDRPEVNQRHYFEVFSSNLPDSWSHVVESVGADNGMIFDFFWMDLDKAKAVLEGNFGELLP